MPTRQAETLATTELLTSREVDFALTREEKDALETLRSVRSQGLALALSRRLSCSGFQEACGKRKFV